MTLGYCSRLICISLASYFLIHTFIGALVSLAAGRAVRSAERWRPAVAARRLFTLRLLPAIGGVFVVAGVCLPSYIALEPSGFTERAGFGCIAAACCGAVLWMCSLARGVRAAVGSALFVRRADNGPVLALSGIVHPRLEISRDARRVLSREELEVALRHERAHWSSQDNLKHLCMLLAPAVLPFGGTTVSLERGWKKFAEWAADDRAVGGDQRQSVALASALVRVARLTRGMPQPALVRRLSGDERELAARVERLLNPEPAPRPSHWTALPAGAALFAAGALAAIMQPAALLAVHRALERLIE